MGAGTATAEAFITHFTNKIFEIYHIQGECFLLQEGQKELIDAIKKEQGILPHYAGIYLGKEKKGGFEPSLALLEILSQHSQKKVAIDDKSAWLFLCGRDVFQQGVVKIYPGISEGLVLVQNTRDENLGYGKLQRGQIRIKNILDRGDFLRREMRKKRAPGKN